MLVQTNQVRPFFFSFAAHPNYDKKERKKETRSRFGACSNAIGAAGLPDLSWYKHTKTGKNPFLNDFFNWAGRLLVG
jgi:hypothetical protein